MEAGTTPALTVTLDGKPYKVELPKRHAERRELATCWIKSNGRGSAAILLYCVPELDLRKRPGNPNGLDPAAYGYDWLEVGADALDLLLGRGFEEIEIHRQGVIVFNAIAALLPPAKQEIETARDFSKATAEGSIS